MDETMQHRAAADGPLAEIISQGDEVISGQTVDGNAAWLGDRLTGLGFRVGRHTTVGDRLADIQAALVEAAGRADLLVCSGGLGPTEDDLTAEAVAAASGRNLAFDPDAMAQISAMFARFDKPMPDCNRKQAMLPSGSTRLDNRWGTAPGFALNIGRSWAVFLPGVPREMRKLFDRRVMPLLPERFELQPGHLVTLRTVAVGESRLQQLIGRWEADQAVLSYRALPPEVQVKLRFRAGCPVTERRSMTDALADRIGDGVFAIEGDPEQGRQAEGDLAAVTLKLLAERALTLSIVECGGGGRLVEMLLRADRCGGLACSEVCAGDGAADADGRRRQATELAVAVRTRYRTQLSLGMSLCADPAAPQAGRGHIALLGDGVDQQRPFKVAGGRDLIRTLGAGAALDLLRRWLTSNDS